MTTYLRSNAWNKGGTFANTDLLWYAKAVGAMQARPLRDPSSWWFFAAMHAQYVKEKAYPGWGSLPGVPRVAVTPEPPHDVSNRYWDQCQHQSWYFLPWHRGYLLAVEAHMRAAIVSSGGPATWALPYWNYFGAGSEWNIPPAFTRRALPDRSQNPLYVTARYGPDNDGHIFIPTPPIFQQHRNDPHLVSGPVTDACLANDLFTGTDPNTPPPGFGGPETGFWSGGRPFVSGSLEQNPHNLIHVYVGGTEPGTDDHGGLMSDPGTAALDPIFYLHHANIDRMWAVWNGSAHANPTAANWLSGPTANGERQFVMPMPDGKKWVFKPQDVVPLGTLDYTYDDLPPLAPAGSQLARRLARLGATASISEKDAAMVAPRKNQELVGASPEPVPLTGTGASATVRLAPDIRRKMTTSLAEAAVTKAPDRVFVHLENVRGTRDATVLSVYINVPEGELPSDHPDLLAGSVGLFGLRRASAVDGAHGGQGLTFLLEITNIIDALHLRDALNEDSLKVTIVPHQRLPERPLVTIGRISIYREGA